MSDEVKLSKLEGIKETSCQLRGTIREELLDGTDQFSGDASQLLKHHGTYQQDDRDSRKLKNPDGTKKRTYTCMVRTRIPGGKVTAEQFLTELDLCEKYGNGTVRLTTRQGFQLHGVVKGDLRETIRAINESKLTTFAACGDVERNVMCCPAPIEGNRVRAQMQEMADKLAEHLKPRTSAYFEIWLEDENGERTDATEFQPVDEPIYGARYLPRKFKTAIALPDDNCVDLLSNDLGLLGIVEGEEIVGYNFYVGGGMGVTPSAKKTFPAVARKMAFVRPDDVLSVAEEIVKVQRDFGNRSDRKIARMKYLIADWGLDRFRAKVEEYLGAKLDEPRSEEPTDLDDHLGWHEQGDGRWFLGINVPSGRIQDTDTAQFKTALRSIIDRFQMRTRLTARQSVLLCDINADDRSSIDNILRDHGVPAPEEQSPLNRYAMACPALPTCGLSITESERILPEVIESLDAELARLGLEDARMSLHITGCPNGCARPYSPDIGLVGKTVGKYTIFLGGNTVGSRLAFIYKDLVPFDDVVPTLVPVLRYYKAERSDGECFGDFCHRMGADAISAFVDQSHGE